MTHVRTSPYYPQSTGRFVEHYNTVRLHSAVGYIAPSDLLAGRSAEIWAARDAKLEAAREARRLRRSGEAA